MRKGKRIFAVILTLILIGGLAYALYPVFTGYFLSQSYASAAEDFLQYVFPNNLRLSDGTEQTEAVQTPYPELLAAMQEYNETIYVEKQAGLCDPWAYQAPSFDLAEYGIDDGVIGVLTIPAIDLEMPIYLGADSGNMAKGAVHLSQTSLPVGGENTNCVIAGHRGWRGAAYFLHVPELEPGDTVTVTNLWESLTYTVTGTAIIEPNDIDAILIQPGRDMLTLITCHPYGSGGRYRYVVYCERQQETNYES